MKNYKKVLLEGLVGSHNIHEDDREYIKEAIEDIYSEVIEELDDRLGLQLYNYKVDVKYYSDGVPESFKHTFW